MEGPVSIELLINTCGICVKHAWKRGEVKNCGIMAIYVDDVLLAAEHRVATSALEAIASIWECSKPEEATLQQSVTFCGFEIQQNDREDGGGYRLHQQSYEAELTKKWEVEEVRQQLDFKLPLPEEEAEFQKSEDHDLIRRAQACNWGLAMVGNENTTRDIFGGVRPCRGFALKLLTSPSPLACESWLIFEGLLWD